MSYGLWFPCLCWVRLIKVHCTFLKPPPKTYKNDCVLYKWSFSVKKVQTVLFDFLKTGGVKKVNGKKKQPKQRKSTYKNQYFIKTK
ncbi:unnamed protein product [Blepharisma stoltei]|uniref:Secreted protein n=1 Tax=Blepharisma stoltei TaxID=1481888 RepID=A0AAU9JQZ7_9CILI|nr:unnamed protein product [Blepharisma stoltei]